MNYAERKETLSVARHVTRKDSLAQLHAMIKINEDSELIEALKNTDIKTFMMISEAQNELIAEKISETGYFIDSDGMQYTLLVPSLEQYTHPGVEYYLSDGIVGLRNAVSLALQHCKAGKEIRGRRKMNLDALWRMKSGEYGKHTNPKPVKRSGNATMIVASPLTLHAWFLRKFS
jgi:hypothetical protein